MCAFIGLPVRMSWLCNMAKNTCMLAVCVLRPQVVEVIVVRDRHSGESKGFGFVRMANEQGAAAALQALDNYLIGEDSHAKPQGQQQQQQQHLVVGGDSDIMTSSWVDRH